MPRLRSPRVFPAPALVRSRSGQSGCIIDGDPCAMTLAEIEKIFREESGRTLATLIRLVGDFDLAEDALQDAFAVALERWPASDPPARARAGPGKCGTQNG